MYNNLKKNLEVIFRTIALGFYYIERVIPRKQNYWLFGDATGFNSNGKHMFLQVLEKNDNIKAYWIGDQNSTKIARSLGLPAYYRYSLKGIWLCLISKYYIVSHTQGCINFWTSGGARIINLWHGIGWKACLWSNPYHKKYKEKGKIANFIHLLFYPHLYYKPDIVLSSSPYMTENFFAPMFDVNYNKCIEDIYPRCSYMLQPQNMLIKNIKRYGKNEEINLINKFSNYDKVFLYAPTFRDAQYDFVKESGIDFEELNIKLKSHNYLLLVKFHPSTFINTDSCRSFSNVWFIDKKIDAYNIMPFTDVLISDYSSIVFDYILLKKRIILFPFDEKKYIETSREMVFEYEELVQGIPLVRTYEELNNKLFDNNDYFSSFNTERIWSKTSDLIEAIYRL